MFLFTAMLGRALQGGRPLSRGTRHDMRSNNKKDLRKPPKPVSSRKVVVIKGRFQRTHKLTQADLREMADDCNVKCTKNFTKSITHAIVDRPWAISEDPRLKEGIKLMKAEWLIKSKNGILASSVEHQWTPEQKKKPSSKNHVGDHGLPTPPDDSLHHSTTIEREHRSPANILIRVEEDRLNTTDKVDDQWGYYIVVIGATFTEKWKLNVPYALSALLIQAADQITGLLGQGSFGIVIKARENGTKREVAIKITRAKDEYRKAAKRELRVLDELEAFDPENVHQCLHWKDCFDYKGHICIVMDLLRQSLHSFLKKNHGVPFPDTHIQIFARQLFKSLAYLHRRQIIHTDIKPDNILLYDDSFQDCPYNQNIPSSSTSINKRAKRIEQRRELLNPKICLIDFGSATFQNESHPKIVTTRYYRAPEVILGSGWSFPCDIWSIGCVLVELLTGRRLFCADADDDNEHLAMMEKVLGEYADMPLPVHFRLPLFANLLRLSDDEFDPNKYTTGESKKLINNMKNLSDIMPSETPFFQEFLDLLQKIFVFDPSKRITAEQALNHPWLKEN